jgi:ornithine cyclodeaminase/alanine dehydrogenase-like protein (mu-crystallin family)
MWEQASHGGDIARAAESGRLRREDVAELGRILAGDERGRRSDDEITVFDSTGLAVQDLAVALTVYERYEREPGAEAFADVVQMEVG